MKRQLHAGLRPVPMILVMATIFYLSHQTGDDLYLPVLPGFDKVAHLAAYGLLAAATLFAFSPDARQGNSRRVVAITLIFCLCFGISDEFHQYFIPGRSVSAFDLLADCLGAVLVCLLWRWTKKPGRYPVPG
jgi:VanZ family protein